MVARVLVVCCEPLITLLHTCRPLLAGLGEAGASPVVRTLPWAGPTGTPRSPAPAREVPAALDPDELAAADGVVFATAGATPHLASSAAAMLAGTARLWAARQLEDRVVTGFTTAEGPAGEEVLSGLLRAACHWGSVLLPGPRPGAADPAALRALGVRMGGLAALAPSRAMAAQAT
ncbi:hypothetical protein ACIRNI_19405 [Streptomyces sp. NPDC093546]|uniref:hypothetical protein n=1 Tax=Streptomyces sp. NPDC093546 TaxID=3366040 RepID=UPI0037F44D76